MKCMKIVVTAALGSLVVHTTYDSLYDLSASGIGGSDQSNDFQSSPDAAMRHPYLFHARCESNGSRHYVF